MAKINYNYYKNNDNYCYYVLNNLDNSIIEKLKSPANDEIIKKENPPLYYFLLSPHKQCLLNWSDNLSGNILEISGGLGINTEYLCKKAESVTTVCFSKINAEIINSRLSGYDNLEIIAGDLKEIKFNKKFDYIVVSDVLELSKILLKNEYIFINYLKSLLTDKGTIICAVSNRYGISNFSGCADHVTGKSFDSINNYPNIKFMSSFTKRELEIIFKKVGFEQINFYYPVPDHYQNRVILSDDSLDMITTGDKIPMLFKTSGINPNRLINEFQAVKDAIIDNKFISVVNSYLIIASLDKENLPATIYAQTHKNVLTEICINNVKKYCKKTALSDEANQTLENMYEFYLSETERINNLGIKNIRYAELIKDNDSYIMEFAEGKSLNKICLEVLFERDKFLAFGMEYKSLIYKLYPNVKYQNYEAENHTLENVACVENANIDLNMSNIYKNGDNYTIIDYDRTAPLIPINYILAQGIFVFTIDAAFSFNEFEYLKLLGLSEDEIRCYQKIFISLSKRKK